MNLAIFTPYRPCDVTAAALRLADLALSKGINVRVAAPGSIDRGVHPYWDPKIYSTKGNSLYKWARQCDQVIWFDYNVNHYTRSGLVLNKDANHWGVPMWHSIPRHATGDLWLYHRLVSPSRAIKETIVESLFEGDARSCGWCFWDSGLNTVTRTSMVKKDHVRVYTLMDGPTIDETGPMVLELMSETLEEFSNAEYTLDCCKSWPKQARKRIKQMKKRFGKRFEVTFRNSLIRQATLLHEHDWAWLPSPRVNTSIMAARALACGTPVICYNIPPYNEIIKNCENGALIDCDTGTNWLGAAVALPAMYRTHTLLSALFAHNSLMDKCRKTDWNLHNQVTAFERFWEGHWGLV
jgi:hypothetical protein